jgi:hypothetical protein
MALTPLVVSLYPNVPQLPGVPQLVRSALFPASPGPTLGTGPAQDQLSAAANNQTPAWWICDADLNPVITPDSILSFGHRPQARISNFPVQAGGFANYNKVFLPYEISVGMSKGGGVGDRVQFLADLETLYKSLALYTILTPERSYSSCNIHRYEVQRHDEKAAYFLTDVEVFFTQIIEVQSQYTTTAVNTQNAQVPAALPPVNQGGVQPQPAVPALFNNPGQQPFVLGTDPNAVFGTLSPPNLNVFQ